MLEEIKGWRVSPCPGLSAGKAWAPAERSRRSNLGPRVPSDSSHFLLLLPSLEFCCKACVAFYHWVMVVVTGGVGMAATLALCSLLVWPIRLRRCES